MRRLLLIVGLFAVGCGDHPHSPVAAVRALGEAAAEGDSARVLQLLGPRTRERLTRDAERASAEMGGHVLAPKDLIASGWTPPRFELDRASEVERSGATAIVEVVGHRGEHERVETVREGGSWKVELEPAR